MPSKWLLGLVLAGLLCITAVHSQSEDEDIDVDIEDDVTEDDEPPPAERPVYKQPKASGTTYFTETFETISDFKKKWVLSEAKKEDTDADIAKYDGQWSVEEASDSSLQGDLGLVLKSRAKHHAISSKLSTPYEFKGKPFVVQFEVKFQNGQECGGAYIKLLTKENNQDLKKFVDRTPYTIMFGPDKCGNDNKLHFIFRHKNPVTGKFEEKHANKPAASLDKYFTDKKTHLYTLVINPDNSYEVYIDMEKINSGSLLEDVSPPINPPKEVVDPEDKKPEDWDDKEKIPDPEAVKPEDWDETEPEYMADPEAVMPEGWLEEEPELVADPESEMPEDWDEDIDGEWEPAMIQNTLCETAPGCGEWTAPMIKNHKYKGKWRAPTIDNPNYKGKWKARKIPNPAFFEDKQPYKMSSIGAVGLELWSMSDDIYFDNFIITDNKAVSDDWSADSWEIKHKHEMSGRSSGRSVVDAIMDATNERPWLWAVFIVVILLPIVLVIVYCCMPGSSKPEDLRGHAKKTDAPSPDDDKEDKEDKDAEDEDDEDEENKDEEKENEKEAEGEEKVADKTGAGDVSPKKAAKVKKSDLEAEEEEESNEADNEEDDANKATKSSPRRRKTRARKD